MYPGAVVPFGMVQFSPDTPTASPSGYRYSDTSIEEFSLTHFNGAGCPNNEDLGIRPTTNTGDPLADAFLWVKTPGQSDGQCDRGTRTGVDPARGNTADPAAGAWFPQQALELGRYANPPLS